MNRYKKIKEYKFLNRGYLLIKEKSRIYKFFHWIQNIFKRNSPYFEVIVNPEIKIENIKERRYYICK